MQFLFELLIQPFFEAVFYVVGYATACVIVPVFTLGHVTVEPFRPIKRPYPKRGRIQRIAPRKYVLEADSAVWIGVLFWALVGVSAYFIQQA